jgi:undecaprenyl-diphosphatase
MHDPVTRFVDLATRLGDWGYLLVAVLIVLECQAIFGFFVPGESLVLVCGFLVGQGVFDLDAVIVAICLGAIVGDTIGFELGRHLGLGWLRRHGARFGVRERHLDKIARFIARHGGKSVFFGHFLHFLRALMPYFAGAQGMRYGYFFFFNALGCAIWATGFTLIGYFVGQSWTVVEKWVGRAGAVGGILLVLVIALVRFWSWLVQHETELRADWAALIERPRVAAFRRRFARQIDFVERRLTPGGYLGLHLTVGFVILLVGGWWFEHLARALIADAPMVATDQRLSLWFSQHSVSVFTHAAWVVTSMGSGVCVATLSLGVAALLVWQKRWYRLVTLVLAVGGGSALNVGIKHLFQRERPVFEHPLVVLHSYSFPSGHTMAATLFYGLMAVFIMQSVRRWPWRVLTFVVAIFVIILVALSRMYLGAHYLSDVLGAMALGVMWLATCITAVELNRRYRLEHRGG